jgi:hypothetical protein
VQVLHERFENDPNVTVLAVHFDGRGDPDAYLKENDFTFRSIPNGTEMARRFGITVIPTFVVVGPDGEVIHTTTGRLTDAGRDEIEQLALGARRDG